MKNTWLTLLTEIPYLDEIINRLNDFGFEITHFPKNLDGNVEIKCKMCERILSAQFYGVDLLREYEGKKIIEKCIADVKAADESSGTEIVMKHLKNTVAIAKISTSSELQCDCDFRFHQAVALGDFIWYVDGRGFADDVETYLELS